MDDPEIRIATLVEVHGEALMRVARHFSLCADDAHDAYQRALEIYLRRLATIDPRTEGAWMRVVVRHEAMAVRRVRAVSVNGEEVDLDARADDALIEPSDRVASAERSARSAEALRRLKPDEARALLLKAEGHSYDEIAARNGWTYTKVNRAITEGRRRFLKTYAELERGDGCSEFAPALEALARGEATAEALISLRPHLRHCPACRATVRELRGGRRRAAGWLPWPVFVWWLGRPSGRSRTGADAATKAPDPAGTPSVPLDAATNAIEAAGSGPAAPAPAVSPGRWAELKLQVQGLIHRVSGSEVGMSAQVAAGSGGGRSISVATLIGICISSLGAGTYCVATLVAPEPPKPIVREAKSRPKPSRPAPERPTEPVRLARPRPTPVATPRPERRRPPRSRPRPASASARSSVIHEQSPPPVPAAAGQQEFGIEQTAPAAPATPAAAPATGGGEFAP